MQKAVEWSGKAKPDPDIYEKVGYFKMIPYLNAFKMMNKVADCSFTSGNVQPGLDMYFRDLEKALDALNVIEEIYVTLKIHVKECLQFIENNNGLGYWSEQSGESL